MYNHAMTSIRVYSRHREEIIDITPQVQRVVAASGHRSGLVAIYCPHTTAGISVNENADPDVKSDMVKFLGKLIPVSKEFRGALLLGEWQQVWFMEFDGPRERDVWLKVIPG